MLATALVGALVLVALVDLEIWGYRETSGGIRSEPLNTQRRHQMMAEPLGGKLSLRNDVSNVGDRVERDPHLDPHPVQAHSKAHSDDPIAENYGAFDPTPYDLHVTDVSAPPTRNGTVNMECSRSPLSHCLPCGILSHRVVSG